MVDKETQKSQETFTCKDFTFTVDRRPKCIVEFHVQAGPSFVQEAYENAAKVVGKQVTIPGFRKGKAPEEMIIKKHAKEIESQLEQEMANLAFPQAEKAAKIPVLTKNAKIQFNVKSRSLEEGAEMVFSFETEPTVAPVDPKKFILKPVKRPPVTDKEIKEAIRQVSFFFAEWNEITDRPAQEGDFLILDVDIVDPPSSLFQNTRFEINDHSMAKWMQQLVIGRKAGESIEGISKPDDDLPEEEKKAFKEEKVVITLQKIEEAILPPFDEKYYRTLGVENEKELTEYMTRLLNEKADAHVQEEERTQVIDFLLNECPFDLPPSYVTNETRFRMQQISKEPGFTQQWSAISEKEQTELINTLMQQSEKAVRLFVHCNQIVDQAEIKIQPEDLPSPPTNILEVLVKPQKEHYVQDSGNLKEAESYSRLVLQKAQDYLIAQAKAVGQ